MQLIAIQQKIYPVRGHRIMLDYDLAELYGVPTKVLNQAVKRNKTRFPGDFIFRLEVEEWLGIKTSMRSQFVTASQQKRNIKTTPFAFTEHGVTMLASVLKSEKAIEMNIMIVRAFIALRQIVLHSKDLAKQITELKQRVDNHSEQLNLIYEAIENMLDEKSEMESKKRKNPIGFQLRKEK